MNVIQMIASSSFLTVNKLIAHDYGLEAAALLGELASIQVYWEAHNGLDEEGMFFETAEQITENTSLTPYQQGKASKILEEAGLLRTKRKGVPAKKYYSIDCNNLETFFKNKFLKNLETRNEKTEKLDPQFFGNTNNNKTNNNRLIRIENNTVLENSALSETVREKVTDFLAYRDEIKKPFKSERGLKSFITQVEKQERVHGAQAVIDCIDTTMQNGWQGVFWDKIGRSGNNGKKELIGPDAIMALAIGGT